MLNPDILSVLNDHDVGGGQPFTIIRATATRVKGRDTAPTLQTIEATGSVQPADRNALEQIPEGDRDNDVIVIRTETMIQNGETTDTGDVMPDEILYHDHRYKVIRTGEWQRWGMYVAYAVRTDPSTGGLS